MLTPQDPARSISSHAEPTRSSVADDLTRALRALPAEHGPPDQALRRAVVRYAAEAGEAARPLDGVAAELRRLARPLIDGFPASRRVELLASIEWWTVHGYYRAD